MQNRWWINSKFKKILIALFITGVFYGVAVLGLRAIGLENLHAGINQLGIWAPVAFVVLCTISVILAPLSSSSIFVTGGVLFGQHIGFLLSFLASVIGCCINFWIARRFGRRVAARLIGQGSLDDLDRFTRRLKNHHSIVFMIVTMPLAQDMVSYAVGLTPVKFWHFFVALIVSGVVVVAGYVYLGSGILEALV